MEFQGSKVGLSTGTTVMQKFSKSMSMASP
jgi:hypothetical protein